ncbi:hypothetical protein NDU88_005356 [Pleurodeles waltl]|uniref:Basic proline-rich protein-like n=1 Tax=Pleurodeles waltl TaxID=8319 RepID=A0AAV7WBK4_PLEWA|nr:hypothetical protein NDU88_005356 [Pleurodeles waltl]
MTGSARSSGLDRSGQPKGAPHPATRAPDPQHWKMTVGGARRFPIVSPHKRQPVLNLGCPERSRSRRRHPGAPGQQTPGLRPCVPQGGGGGHTQSGLLTGQLRGAPRLRVSLSCVVSQPGGIRLRPRAEGRSNASRCPQQMLQAAPPPQNGPAFKASAGRRTPLRPGPRPQLSGEPRGPRPAPGRTSLSKAAPGAAAAPKSFRLCRPLSYCSPTRGVPRHSAPRPRPLAGPRPPHSPEQPESLGGPLRGGKTAPPRSPRPQQSPHSAPNTGPPASTHPGTGAKSAPPEPIRQACAMLGSVATPPQHCRPDPYTLAEVETFQNPDQ